MPPRLADLLCHPNQVWRSCRSNVEVLEQPVSKSESSSMATVACKTSTAAWTSCLCIQKLCIVCCLTCTCYADSLPEAMQKHNSATSLWVAQEGDFRWSQASPTANVQMLRVRHLKGTSIRHLPQSYTFHVRPSMPSACRRQASDLHQTVQDT